VTPVKFWDNQHYLQWAKKAPLGLLLVGLGLSVTGHAISQKSHGKPWFWWGTVGLVIVNSGISVVGDAVRHRTLMDIAPVPSKNEVSVE
jgi:hypothetical protein